MKKNDLEGKVRTAVIRAGVEPSERVISGLCSYLLLLWDWNKKINLTKLDDSVSGLDRLIGEPLAVSTGEIEGSNYKMIDIGSGGGSPGIPLILLNQTNSLVLIEKKEKKGIFLREVIRELCLKNVSVEIAHYEELANDICFKGVFDLLTVRGVRIDKDALVTLRMFLKVGGKLFLFGPLGGTGIKDVAAIGFISAEERTVGCGRALVTVFTNGE